MKRHLFFAALFIIFFISFSSRPATTASAKENWIGVRSKNFLLVGNAGEKEIRKVAIKLEQFREIFSKLFPKANLNSSVPITVVVFKNRAAYRPFMPVYQGRISEVAGYFQPGPDVHYITLTAEMSEVNPFGTIFHEYVHALTSDNTFQSPPWFSEGLAEYYSTFEVTDGEKKVWLGKPIGHHVLLLRENKFLPLPRLFAVDHASPEYNESDKKGVFYAQSWALVHYLLLGNNAKRQPQFLRYMELLANGTPVGESFQQAFQTDFATIEKELRDYIGRSSYPAQYFTSDQKMEFDTTMQTLPVSEAESQYYLGDLVLHLNRTDAEEYLQKAITLDPNLGVAQASMGMLRIRQGRFADAKQHLERAVTSSAQNHMVHYYYAEALSREAMDSNNVVHSFSPQSAKLMREHLKKSIALSPSFTESYRLLAFVNTVTGEELDESVQLLTRAIRLSPGKQILSFMLAQLYMRQQKYDEARKLVQPLAQSAPEPQLRQQAQSLLDSINRYTEQMAQYEKLSKSENTARVVQEDAGNSGNADGRPRVLLRRRFDGEKVTGLLTQIECSEKGMTLKVKTGDRVLELNTTSPERIQFVTFTPDVQESITCGPIKPPKKVTVTYRTPTDASSKFDGEPIAVEFLPPDKQ